MATIRKKGQKWQAIVRKPDLSPIYKTFTLKADAEKWAKKTEVAVENGTYGQQDLKSVDVAALIERYRKDALPALKSVKTCAAQLKKFEEELGHVKLSHLSPEHITHYRDTRLRDVSSSSVKRELATLRRLLNLAIKEWGYKLPQGNPVNAIEIPKEAPSRTRRLSNAEEKALLREISPAIRPIVEFAIETCMRRGELVNIEWTDVHLKKRLLHIPHTKTNEPRTIPLSSRAVEILREIEKSKGASTKVFQVEADSVTRAFIRACQRLKITGLRFHDLRHEATSRLFEKGFNTMEASVVTGHKTLEMLKRYTHLNPASLLDKIG